MKCFIPIPQWLSILRDRTLRTLDRCAGPQKEKRSRPTSTFTGAMWVSGKGRGKDMKSPRFKYCRFFQAQIVRGELAFESFRSAIYIFLFSEVHCERTKVRCSHLLVDIFKKHRSSKFSEKNRTPQPPSMFSKAEKIPKSQEPAEPKMYVVVSGTLECLGRVSRWVGLEGLEVMGLVGFF